VEEEVDAGMESHLKKQTKLGIMGGKGGCVEVFKWAGVPDGLGIVKQEGGEGSRSDESLNQQKPRKKVGKK